MDGAVPVFLTDKQRMWQMKAAWALDHPEAVAGFECSAA